MGKINVGEVLDYILTGGLFKPHRIVIVPDVDSPEFAAEAILDLTARGVAAKVLMPYYEDLAALDREERERLLNG